MRRILSLFVVLAVILALTPASASALTVQEVVDLSKAGVADNVLLAMIERDHTIFAIDASQVAALKRDAVSEKVVIAMLKSGRDVPDQTASAEVVANPLGEPIVVSVGHGPDRPNTYHNLDRLGGFIPLPPAPLFYSIPYPIVVSPAPHPRRAVPCAAMGRAPAGSRQSVAQADCRRSR
jgi:hypothetical protein